MGVILSVKNLVVPNPEANGKNIVDNVSFDVNEGEVVVLSGSNGSGKSTILESIALVTDRFQPQKGSLIAYDDYENILTLSKDQKQSYRQKISYLGQEDKFLEQGRTQTVADCLQASANNYFSGKALSKNEIEEILHTYAPSSKEKGKPQFTAKSKPFSFSGGEKRLLSIIESIVVRDTAKLFIIDEPLNNLDTYNMKIVSNLINKIHQDRPATAFLLVTHCRIFPFIAH